MSVASGRAGRVLARLFFRRPNAHVRALNTREVNVYKLVSRAV